MTADTFHEENNMQRGIVIATLNNAWKPALKSTESDDFLIGKNLDLKKFGSGARALWLQKLRKASQSKGKSPAFRCNPKTSDDVPHTSTSK